MEIRGGIPRIARRHRGGGGGLLLRFQTAGTSAADAGHRSVRGHDERRTRHTGETRGSASRACTGTRTEVVPEPEPLPEPEPEPEPEPQPAPPPVDDASVKAEQEALRRKEVEDARVAEERRVVAEREAAQRREAEARQKAERETAERERKERERVEREKQAAERARVQRESELNAQIQAEERVAAARASGAMAQYIGQITGRIERAWIRPSSARPGLECEVRVTQAPGGTVTAVQVTRCNGDEAVRQSIETAVLRASPLPLPSDPALFERNLVVTFRPQD